MKLVDKVHVIKIKSNFENGYLEDTWSISNVSHYVKMFDPVDIIETKRIAERFEDGYDADYNLRCEVVEWTIKEKAIKI